MTSLSAIRSIATSALQAAQVQMAVASSNIANADTDGYARRIATQVATVTDGVGSGVAVTAIRSVTDRFLVEDLREATTILSAATVTADALDRLQALFGGTAETEDGGGSLAAGLADLEASLTALALSPDDEGLKAEAIAALEVVASDLNTTAAGLQDLRADADEEIADAVAAANDAITEIDRLNDAIASATAAGLSTADLEDQRTAALSALAEEVGIVSLTGSDGRVRVYTTAGAVLVDGSAHTFAYDPAAVVTADTVFSAVTLDGVDVTDGLASGRIGALLTLRDETLPDVTATLDALAVGLVGALNAASAAGTADPPPTSLTGTTVSSSTDAFAATGTLQIALTGEDGVVTATASVDLSAYGTVADLVAALDGLDGVSATLDAAGQLVVAAEDGSSGVVLAETDVAVGDDGSGFSAWFGFNAVLTGSDAATIAVRADLVETPGLLATAVAVADAAVGESALASGNSAIADGLVEALSGDRDFAAAGRLSARSATLADYAAAIVGQVAATAEAAATSLASAETTKATAETALAAVSGVNVDEETARIADLETWYQTAAQLLSVLNEMFEALLAAAKTA